MKNDTPAKSAAYSELPADPRGIVDLIEKQSYVLRLRAIARLDNKGLAPEEIVKELRKSGEDITLDMVLHYMGKGAEGTPKERGERMRFYDQVRAEVTNAELIDVDAQVSEKIARALDVMTALMDSADERIAMAAAKEMLKYGGVGADTVEVHRLEVRVSEKHVDALTALAGWKAPKGELAALMEPESPGMGVAHCECGFRTACPKCAN